MENAPIDLKARARRAMLESGFQPDFPAEVVRELSALKQAGPKTPAAGIRDLRGLLWSSIDNDTSRDLDQVEYVEQAPDAIITTCLRGTSDGKTIHSRSRQHYAAQIDAFQRQVPGSLRQQVQYGRIVRSFLIHNGVMLQAGWQYRPHSTSE